MTQQSSKEQTPLHSASPKGSVDGKHCEETAHSFSADGKRQAIPAGVDPSLDASPSCPHPMSPMAISPVSLSLSCSLSLSFACCLSLSLSLSLSLPQTLSLPLVLLLCVCLALCSFSLALYPDACKLHIAVAVQGLVSIACCRYSFDCMLQICCRWSKRYLTRSPYLSGARNCRILRISRLSTLWRTRQHLRPRTRWSSTNRERILTPTCAGCSSYG